MNDVPYEFIDRVFTKLNIADIKTIALEAPVWKEVKRVYKEKYLSLRVNLYLPNADHNFKYEISKETDLPMWFTQGSQFTLDEALKLDTRFNRVNQFHICKRNSHEFWIDLDVERIPDLLDYASHFNLTTLVLHHSSQSPTDFETQLAAREFRTTTLNMDYFLRGNQFLKKQLQNAELQTLITRDLSYYSADLMDDLQTFVCRPRFQRLHSEFPCFTINHLELIVSNWKTLPVPWSDAQITFPCDKTLADDLEFVFGPSKNIYSRGKVVGQQFVVNNGCIYIWNRRVVIVRV